MLPPGLTAHLAARADHDRLSRLHPSARTVVELRVGACACDLVRPRHPDRREDERHHRHRSRQGGGARAALIAGLDRHRRGAGVPPPPEGWPRALAAFVAEHARNAGETLYHLRFDLPASGDPAVPPVRRLSAATVIARPLDWLVEEVPVVVGR
jgi:hypothetical protein